MVDSEKVISVIIPVYNTERYIERCLDSLAHQTYKELEVVIVDDGSVDNSGKICDEFAARDTRFRVVHKANGGQAIARNVAIGMIKGKYVAFVDSDDWLDLDAYEFSLIVMNESHVDAVIFDYFMTNSRETQKTDMQYETTIFQGKDALQWFMYASSKSSRFYGMCAGLYKKQVIEGLQFREGRVYEDMDFRYRVISKCNSIAVTNAKKYNYFIADNSTTTSGLRKQDFQLREANELLCELASKETYGSIKELGESKKARTAFSLLSKIVFYGISDKAINRVETIKLLKQEHRRYLKVLLASPMDFKRKFLACMMAVSVEGTARMIRLLGLISNHIVSPQRLLVNRSKK